MGRRGRLPQQAPDTLLRIPEPRGTVRALQVAGHGDHRPSAISGDSVVQVRDSPCACRLLGQKQD